MFEYNDDDGTNNSVDYDNSINDHNHNRTTTTMIFTILIILMEIILI